MTGPNSTLDNMGREELIMMIRRLETELAEERNGATFRKRVLAQITGEPHRLQQGIVVR